MPFGIGARPVFNWTAAGSPAIPLALSGTTASLSVPWDTCSWSDVGLVSLPNPSAGVDAALFTVSGSITVDKKTLATSTPRPQGSYTGPTVPSLTGEEPPSIAVYGPETLRVSKKRRVVRLVVFSSGTGSSSQGSAACRSAPASCGRATTTFASRFRETSRARWPPRAG